MTSAPLMQARAVERSGHDVRRFLIVGSGSQFQRRLRQVDPSIETVVLCRASVVPFVAGVEENQGVVILRDGTPTDRWVSVARRIHDEWHVQAIASLSEVDQDKAAAVADALGLSCHSIETVACVNDKQRMRDALSRSGVERLPYRQVRSLDALEAFYDEVGPPLILKPTSGRASVGVSVVKSRDELAAALRHTQDARGPRLDPSPPLAERYVDGPEFSVESITHAGIHHVFAVTEKFRDLATKVETGHVVPARIDVVAERALIEHIQAALTALGVRTGITHTEVILGAGGPVIVETHLREAGDEILHLVEDASRVDLADLYLRQVAGEDISQDSAFRSRRDGPHYSGGAAIRYLAADLHGVLEGVDGWERIAGMPGVRDSKQLIADGTPLQGLTDSYARLGYVRVMAADPDAAVSAAEEAVAHLSVRHRR